MKAIFEVEFDPDVMISQEDLKEQYGGNWLKFMKYLFREEGMGIFDTDLKLIKVEEQESND